MNQSPAAGTAQGLGTSAEGPPKDLAKQLSGQGCLAEVNVQEVADSGVENRVTW